jgi:threonine dehydrogenase-like Zn-dependent dehydrogenase
MMKGVVPVGNYHVEVRDFEIPEPGEGEVLIDVKCAGICGSDLNTFRMTWEQIGERQNLVVGHEAGGIVSKVGPGVKNVEVGQRVCVYHYMGCGKCQYCLEGIYGWCEQKRAYGWHVHGAMSEFLITEEKNCCPLPEELTFEDAAFLACSAGTAFSALKKLDKLVTDGYLAVMGLGPIGTVASLMAQAKGWKTIAMDVSESRVEFARKQGLNVFCPEKGIPLADQLRGRMNNKLPVRIFDTTGHPEGLADCFDIAGNGSWVLTIGKGKRTYKMSERIDISELVLKQIVFMTSWVFTLPEYYQMVEFMLDHKLSFDNLVTGRFEFKDAQQAFEKAASPDNGGKTVFIKK